MIGGVFFVVAGARIGVMVLRGNAYRFRYWIETGIVAGFSLLAYGMAEAFANSDRYLVTLGTAIASAALASHLRR
jgi:hypothetical protein